jgi:hypothetical protein
LLRGGQEQLLPDVVIRVCSYTSLSLSLLLLTRNSSWLPHGKRCPCFLQNEQVAEDGMVLIAWPTSISFTFLLCTWLSLASLVAILTRNVLHRLFWVLLHCVDRFLNGSLSPLWSIFG